MADPSDEPTVTEAVAELRRLGFDDDAFATAGGVRCTACGTVHRLVDLVVEEIRRVEGLSDPADEAIVLGLRCQSCGARVVLVAGYGPTASAEDAAVVAVLRSR